MMPPGGGPGGTGEGGTGGRGGEGGRGLTPPMVGPDRAAAIRANKSATACPSAHAILLQQGEE